MIGIKIRDHETNRHCGLPLTGLQDQFWPVYSGHDQVRQQGVYSIMVQQGQCSLPIVGNQNQKSGLLENSLCRSEDTEVVIDNKNLSLLTEDPV